MTVENSGFPACGEVFREYFYHYNSVSNLEFAYHIPVIDPNARGITGTELREKLMIERPLYLTITDLKDAVRAELIVEYWGGHIGTALPGFRVNGSDYLPMPGALNTPTARECYYRCFFGHPTAPIPLDMLKEGVNEFCFAAGSQIKYNFDAGFFWIYSFGVRVYYDAEKKHPEATILSPHNDQILGDQAVFQVEVKPVDQPVISVDFVGNYEDFNWSGSGLWRDWQLQYHYGTLIHHLGSAYHFPWNVAWRSAWIPDQPEPFEVRAKVTDASGLSAITSQVTGLTLKRLDRSIVLYPPSEVPENFGSRLGRKKTCKINITDRLEDVYAAHLIVSNWSGRHDGQIFLNDQQIASIFGKVHDVSVDCLPVPVSCLKEGENIFAVKSDTEEHAVEINWPGPALFVQYNRARSKR